jgi:hypothetical protein
MVATVALDAIVAVDKIVAFVIPGVALLTSLSVMWREERLYNFTVLQIVHLYNHVKFVVCFCFIITMYLLEIMIDESVKTIYMQVRFYSN